MRRPALYRPATGSGWSHPYTGPAAHAVFYNSGGGPPAIPVTPPSPASMPGAPGNPPAAPPASDPALVQMPQDRLNSMMAKEKDEGRRSALRAIAEAAGLDPDSVDLSSVGNMLKQAQEASRAQMSEVERREADAKAAQERAAQTEAAAKARATAAAMEIALVRLGAQPDGLPDTAAILRNDLATVTDPTDEQIREYAEKLKTRRPQDFGVQAPASPGTLPPAPSGTPAGGPPPRGSGGTKTGDRGREMARRRGHLKPAS